MRKQLQVFKRLRKKGYEFADLEILFGLDRFLIIKSFKKWKVDYSKKERILYPNQQKMILSLNSLELTPREISKITDISSGRIRRFLNKNRIVIGSKKTRNEFLKYNEVCELYKEGANLSGISAYTGVSKKMIDTILSTENLI